jgi:hypothetical protein
MHVRILHIYAYNSLRYLPYNPTDIAISSLAEAMLFPESSDVGSSWVYFQKPIQLAFGITSRSVVQPDRASPSFADRHMLLYPFRRLAIAVGLYVIFLPILH